MVPVTRSEDDENMRDLKTRAGDHHARRNSLRHMVFRSVAERGVRSAACAVLKVPAPKNEED